MPDLELWELIDEQENHMAHGISEAITRTYKMEVDAGWVYRTITVSGDACAEAMVFVPA